VRQFVRIIGGEWRGRRIRFPASEGLRPTPDRVRETLFNWLQPVIHGAQCLDLFAGSGALGLEALSRGAAGSVFVERDARVALALSATLVELGAGAGAVMTADAEHFLAGSPRPFDIVFLDPPFARAGVGELCTLLERCGWLAPGAYVYLEQSARAAGPELPPAWTAWREMRAGEVWARLLRRRSTPAVDATSQAGVPS
jgi:16S rRNA (guanine966-N2)-methyltransferase